jgi:tRNA threonylcarbamoyladenosine biosynthesis protein TsaB
MIILGLETATRQVGCALGGNDGTLASFHLARGRRHAETLAPAIEFVCGQSGVALDEVNVIAVDIGPGLFTGLRVGISTGKALASALRLPMIGMTSLDLLAYPQRRGDRLIASVVDARRGEVFWALYQPVPAGVQRVSDYSVGSAADLAAELMARGDDALAVGDGAMRYAETLKDVGNVEVSVAYPSAEVLVELAHPTALREDFVQPSDLMPLYLRKADVHINWASRHPAPSAAEAG